MITQEQFWQEGKEKVLDISSKAARRRFTSPIALVNGVAELDERGGKKLLLVALFGKSERGEFGLRIASSILHQEIASPTFFSLHPNPVEFFPDKSLMCASQVWLVTDFIPGVPNDRGNVTSQMDLGVFTNEAKGSWIGDINSGVGRYALQVAAHLY